MTEILNRDLTVDQSRVITFMGPDMPVYGTPNMLEDVEMACRDLLLEHLSDEQDSVGIGVQLQHTGAAVRGDTVAVSATMTSFDGRQADFTVTVRRGDELIGEFTHQRAAIPVQMLKKRIASLLVENG